MPGKSQVLLAVLARKSYHRRQGKNLTCKNCKKIFKNIFFAQSLLIFSLTIFIPGWWIKITRNTVVVSPILCDLKSKSKSSKVFQVQKIREYNSHVFLKYQKEKHHQTWISWKTQISPLSSH
jgi:hypothetical protein